MERNRVNKPLSAKQERQQHFARKRWRLMSIIGTTHFAEKGMRDLLDVGLDQDFYILQMTMQSIRTKLNKELAKQKLQQQVQISKEKADADTGHA